MTAPISLNNGELDLTNKLVRDTIHEKIVGSIFASALGDTVGLYTEFLPKSSCLGGYPTRHFSLVDPVTPRLEDSHRSRFPPNHWTDDTDQALLLLLEFVHTHGADPDAFAFADRLRIWVQQGLRALDTLPMGLGGTVGAVVLDAGFLNEPARVAHRRWVKGSRQNAANGSLMRTHPIGVFGVAKSIEETFELATRISETTHADPRCTVSCCISVGLIRGLLVGEVQTSGDIDEMVSRAADWVDQRVQRTKGEVAEDDARKDDPMLDREELRKHTNAASLQDLLLDESQKIGYVYKCLGSGVVLLRTAIKRLEREPGVRLQMKLFEELMTELVMEGGDADTNGACAGAMVGALIGFMRLPQHWTNGLLHRDWLLTKAETASQLLGFFSGTIDSRDNADAAPDGGRGLLNEQDLERRWQIFVVDMVQRDQQRKKEAEAKRKQANGRSFLGMFK